MHWAWAGLFIRSAVILIAAEILRRFPRRSAPVYRHQIVLAAFGMLLAWPLFSAVLPVIHVPLWPHLPVRGTVTVQQTMFLLERDAPPSYVLNWPSLVWTAGIVFALAPVLIGYLKVLQMARRALPLRDTAWSELFEELCRELNIAARPELLMAPIPIMPLTFGMREPRILLPADCLEWPVLRRRAVLLHELAHIRRRDVLAQLFANVVTALWWFQPLCWMSRSNLRRESERACDVVVLASGIRPSDYATELLDIAQSFSRGRRFPAAAITMARHGQLEARLNAILDPQPNTGAKRLSLAAISLLTLLTLTASAVTLLPKQETDSPGGSLMKRTVLTGLLASAGLSAATIGGSLLDPTGAAIPNAKVSLSNPDTMAEQDATTASDGKFSFENLPAGQYILRVEKPGFALLFREFNVQPDSNVERALILKLGSNPNQVRVGGVAQQSKLINKVQPVYPVAAKAARVQGTVDLEVVISSDGVPQEIRVISSPSDDLTQSALDAVRQWRYSSTLLNGRPVEVVTDVIVNYTLLP